jgi:hypothetical protein
MGAGTTTLAYTYSHGRSALEPNRAGSSAVGKCAVTSLHRPIMEPVRYTIASAL